MNETLLLLIINSLVCIGVFYSTKDGYILSFLSLVYDQVSNSNKHLNLVLGFIRKPFFGCIACMGSIWGLMFVCYFTDWGVVSVNTFFYIFALMALNMILNSFITIGAVCIKYAESLHGR